MQTLQVPREEVARQAWESTVWLAGLWLSYANEDFLATPSWGIFCFSISVGRVPKRARVPVFYELDELKRYAKVLCYKRVTAGNQTQTTTNKHRRSYVH